MRACSSRSCSGVVAVSEFVGIYVEYEPTVAACCQGVVILRLEGFSPLPAANAYGKRIAGAD